MTYTVRLTEAAEAESDDIYFWILGRSPDNAAKWLSGVNQAIESLAEFPHRCPVAREDVFYESTIRQHLYGKYRILYSLVDEDGDGVDDAVHILHIRHGARQDIGEE